MAQNIRGKGILHIKGNTRIGMNGRKAEDKKLSIDTTRPQVYVCIIVCLYTHMLHNMLTLSYTKSG